MRRGLQLAVGLFGVALGAVSLALARRDPGYSFHGTSALAGTAELLAGYALLAVGVVALGRERQWRLGGLLVAASCGWFIVEWNNPGVGSAFVFTVGLALYVIAPPLVAHAALGFPDGRVRPWPNRLGLAVAYAGAVLVLGLLVAAVYDPPAQECWECPRNLLLVHGSQRAYDTLNRFGVRLGLVWALLLVALLAGGLARTTPARRRLAAPVVVAASAYLGLVAAEFAVSLGSGLLGYGRLDRRLWLAEAAALVALAAGVAWSWLHARRTRSRVARLTVELAQSPAPGGLRDVLAGTLGDESLQLAYPLPGGRTVDASGRSVQLDGETTSLVRAGREVALLAHRPGLLDDPVLADEVAAAARLALENERLHAEAQAQLDDLRASRSRIIEAGDGERRRLERDLHDGAQQRLVGLALELRLARSRLEPNGGPTVGARLDEADAELRMALGELRDLAAGIFPAVLADEGLAAAFETLAEEAGGAVELRALPEERLEAPVEAAAYFVVSETVRRRAGNVLTVSAVRSDGRLLVEISGRAVAGDLVALEDRVGALDGSLAVVPDADGAITLHAEIPCAS